MEMPPECVAVKKFVPVLRYANTVLNFSVGMNTSAVRARNAMSQRVSVTHHLLHKQIDEVLEFIPVANVNDKIHNWSETSKSDKRVTNCGYGITLTEYVSSGANQRLKTFGIDPVASKHPRLLPLYEVIFQEGDVIDQGGFAGIYRGEWLRTIVAIKVIHEDDRNLGSSTLFSTSCESGARSTTRIL